MIIHAARIQKTGNNGTPVIVYAELTRKYTLPGSDAEPALPEKVVLDTANLQEVLPLKAADMIQDTLPPLPKTEMHPDGAVTPGGTGRQWFLDSY